jgi:hypothetical protein
LTPFIEAEERARYRQWCARLIALPAGLEREPKALARLSYVRGHAALVINGVARPALMYRGVVDPLSAHGRRQIRLFRDAGVHVYAG